MGRFHISNVSQPHQKSELDCWPFSNPGSGVFSQSLATSLSSPMERLTTEFGMGSHFALAGSAGHVRSDHSSVNHRGIYYTPYTLKCEYVFGRRSPPEADEGNLLIEGLTDRLRVKLRRSKQKISTTTISIGRLNALRHLHRQPINPPPLALWRGSPYGDLVVSQGS